MSALSGFFLSGPEAFKGRDRMDLEKGVIAITGGNMNWNQFKWPVGFIEPTCPLERCVFFQTFKTAKEVK